MELARSYRVLGVPSDANVPEIRNAFRKLALEYHPDRNKSPEAAKFFEAITEAYDTIMSSDLFSGVSKATIPDNNDGLDLERGKLAFSILTEKERVYHVSPVLFESEIRRHFHPGMETGTFCKVGKRWFEFDGEARKSIFRKREGLVEWYKDKNQADARRPATWADFWSYVRHYATLNVSHSPSVTPVPR